MDNSRRDSSRRAGWLQKLLRQYPYCCLSCFTLTNNDHYTMRKRSANKPLKELVELIAASLNTKGNREQLYYFKEIMLQIKLCGNCLYLELNYMVLMKKTKFPSPAIVYFLLLFQHRELSKVFHNYKMGGFLLKMYHFN